MSPIAESPTSTNKLHNETLSFLPTRFRSDIVCGTYYSPCPTMCSWLLGQTKPQAKNTLEEALSSHLDIANSKITAKNKLYTCLSRYGKSRIDRIYSKIPCEFINVLPFDKQYKYYHAPILFFIGKHPTQKQKEENRQCPLSTHNVNTQPSYWKTQTSRMYKRQFSNCRKRFTKCPTSL